MKAILDRIARWNLLVSAVAVSLSVAGFALLGIPIHGPTTTVIGVGTFLVYTLDRRLPYSPEDGVCRRRADPVAISALLASPCLAAYACVHLSPIGLWVVGGLAACSVAYVLPLLPGRRRLKDVAHAKGVVVSLGWGAATVLLPAGATVDVPVDAVALLFLYRVLYLTPNLLLSDWPDRENDRSAGIRTAANRLPGQALVRRCRIAVLAAAAVATAAVCTASLPWWIWLEFPALIVLLLIARPPLPADRRFYVLAVDALAGWPGIPALLLGAGW